jgi:uncharacterized protein (TIGR00255 family)
MNAVGPGRPLEREKTMTRSMTGYGKAEIIGSDGKFVVEIRSVNHRYGEVTVKLPRQMLALEGDIRRRVAERFKRGKIDLFIQFEAAVGNVNPPAANIPLAVAYHEAFNQVRLAIGSQDPVPLGLILSQKDVLATQDAAIDLDTQSADLTAALTAALDSLEAMRLKEGELLAREIAGRITLVSELVEGVASRAPLAVAANGERLKERIVRLLGETPVDEMRLAQEVAILADRMEITEELVRLRSHFKQFHATMGMDEPVGRKLDFLLQEMNREVNTIGSKANDAAIAAIVVELKSEMEKVREQVQNIE